MARRTSAPPTPEPARLTPQDMQSGINRLQKRLDEVRKFEPTSVTEQYNIPHVEALAASVDEALVRTFGADTLEYKRYAEAVRFDNGPHNYAFHVPIEQVHGTLGRCKARSIALLGQAIASLKERIIESAAPMAAETASGLDLSKIFVVHGHDGAPKAEVARFIERLGFEAIVLHERANKGRALITKFREEAAGVGFAVVLMTPDDLGKAKDDSESRYRARQNVVFELGFFIGKLGPERVTALVKGDIEIPSDFEGVVYISLDREDWQTRLGSELQEAGYEVDRNKVMRR
jgi:predicted nucleotide-binding protein